MDMASKKWQSHRASVADTRYKIKTLHYHSLLAMLYALRAPVCSKDTAVYPLAGKKVYSKICVCLLRQTCPALHSPGKILLDKAYTYRVVKPKSEVGFCFIKLPTLSVFSLPKRSRGRNITVLAIIRQSSLTMAEHVRIRSEAANRREGTNGQGVRGSLSDPLNPLALLLSFYAFSIAAAWKDRYINTLVQSRWRGIMQARYTALTSSCSPTRLSQSVRCSHSTIHSQGSSSRHGSASRGLDSSLPRHFTSLDLGSIEFAVEMC